MELLLVLLLILRSGVLLINKDGALPALYHEYILLLIEGALYLACYGNILGVVPGTVPDTYAKSTCT